MSIRNLALAVAALSACIQPVNVPKDTQDRVLAQYVHGESLETLAASYHLGDRETARAVVHEAMLALQRRYYQDRP